MKKFFLLIFIFFLWNMKILYATDISGNISTDTSWDTLSSPYIINGDITINPGVTLTIEPGVEVEFQNGRIIKVNGSLKASHTKFSSENLTPSPGDWGYIQVGENSTHGNLVLDTCVVEFAIRLSINEGDAYLTNTDLTDFNSNGLEVEEGGYLFMTGGLITTRSNWAESYGSGIYARSNSHLILTGVHIEHFYYGILLEGSSEVTISDLIISNCNRPIKFQGQATLNRNGLNNFTGNTNTFIEIGFNSLSESFTLPSLGIPYYLPSGLNINSDGRLVIQSNTILKFPTYTTLDVSGSIAAIANQSENIYFTSFEDDGAGGDTNGDGTTTTPQSGSWYGIRFFDSCIDTACVLDGCKINYAGLHQSGGLYFTNSAPSIYNCEINNCFSGIYINSGGAPKISTISINSCTYPYFFNGEGNLSIEGIESYIGNANNYAYLYFDQVYRLLGLSSLSIPYVLPYGMTIQDGARFVIGSNAILKINYGQSVDINGTLIAKANPGENIYFTSFSDDNWGGDSNNDGTASAPVSGNWNGVRFNDTSVDSSCVMRRCYVRYGGSNNNGGINMNNSSPIVDSCEISNSYFGVYLQGASNPVLTHNTIGSSQITPIAMSFEANPLMKSNILSFSDNEYDAIGIIGGTLSTDAHLKIRSVTSIPNITYILLDQIIIPNGKTLTIDKGIIIKLYNNYISRIIVEGDLIANGTADSMIVFTSVRDDSYGNPADCNKDGTITSPSKGDWGGIVFNPGGGGVINYCLIKYAQISNYGFTNCNNTESLHEAAVAMIDASPIISNCEFKDLTYGISCYRVSNPVISHNKMINITYTPLSISGSSNPTLSGNTMTNVGWQAIGLLGGNVCQDGTISKRDFSGYTNITYVLLSDMIINSGTFVSVEPGVVIKFNQWINDNYCGGGFYGCNIYVDGGFKTDGLSNQQVIFTSIKDDNVGNPNDTNGDGNGSTPAPGDWGYIKFRATSIDNYCNLNYSEIKYSGRYSYCNNSEGAIAFENASGKLTNSTVTNCSNYGVFCSGNSTPQIENVTIKNCSLDPIAMSLTSDPFFSNITFTSNYSQAIKIIEGDLSSNATLKSRDVAGIANIAYIISNLTISSNAKLKILPGVVIKFRGDNSCYSPWIVINGNLIAIGTPQNKIYFTSFADDSKGGDSNSNGNTSTPAKGDWGTNENCWSLSSGGIKFVNNSIISDSVNVLKNCEISYAGIGIRVENSHATIDSCLIQQMSGYGSIIVGSANPEFKNCQFYNISNSPIELSMFSNPTFTNCSALNNGIMALSIIPETYSQTATVPKRNFGGYENISYYLEDNCTINSGTTITIPAGVVFKSSRINDISYCEARGFIVNGRLNIEGTSEQPVVFTHFADDNYGNPKDMNQDGNASKPYSNFFSYPEMLRDQRWYGNWITFNDVSDDSSKISNVVFKYSDNGISTLSASPRFDSIRFEKLGCGIDMNGVSSPKIDNCTFHNLEYFPIQISLVSFPSSLSNNIISGTTYKVIKVRNETLTQDVILPNRDLGGINNIPYYFDNYTIGTGAKLTINPGIVCKFKAHDYWGNNGNMKVSKGLIAIGGASPDSTIVFTSILDDYYGGDSNSDGATTTVSNSDWIGLIFENESLDPLCKLNNCIIRFADKGIQTNSSSPTIENCNINNNNFGVYATAASNPVFNFCDFSNNISFAIDNVDKSFEIKAENCWWGSNSGPNQSNTPGDGSNLQQTVSEMVDFTPWRTSGTQNPLMGDVSLNGLVQAYDASLILQYSVGSLALTSTQQTVADASGSSGITAYDASLILQYVVGLIKSFPAELKSTFISEPTAQLIIGNETSNCGEDILIPLSLTNVSNLYSAKIKLKYNPESLRVKDVIKVYEGMTNMSFYNDSINGNLTIALAGVNPMSTDTILANIIFRTRDDANSAINELIVKEFIGNESNLTRNAIGGLVILNDVTTYFKQYYEDKEGALSVYPNPSNGKALLSYRINEDYQLVEIDIVNTKGQKIATLVDETKNKGKYTIPISGRVKLKEPGLYFAIMIVNGKTQIIKFQIVK